MPCLICNHTVQNLGLDQPGRRVFWCPRCGALKTESGDFDSTDAPRWTRLLMDAQWHQAKLEASDAGLAAKGVEQRLAEVKGGRA